MKPAGFAERLAEFTAGRRRQPYAWGTNDCVTFAADAVQAVTGTDPMSDLRGSWDSESAALAVLEAQGGLIAAMDARFPRKAKEFAQRGDLVLVKDANGQPSLAVCVGKDAASPGEDEMLLTPMGKVRMAWEV